MEFESTVSSAARTTYTELDGSVTGASLNAEHNSARDIIDAGLLTMEAANSLLETFKTTLTPHFPFVVIAPQTTAKELRQEKPCLFLAVLAAASYEDMPLQRSLSKKVSRAISDRMIRGGEMSLDLLQGLLVHLAWYSSHLKISVLLQPVL